MKLLLLLLHAAPVFVPRVVGRVTSTSTTHLGTIDLVASSMRRETKRRGLGERQSDVRRRQDVPNTQHAPVEVKVQVTMPMTHDVTTSIMMATTTANVSAPAGVGGGVQVDGAVNVTGSRKWSHTQGVAGDGVSPGLRRGGGRRPEQTTLMQ